MATISLCMIANNEENCIGKALETTAPYVDEIIVVDGGPNGPSTDGTKEIVLSFPKAQYHEREWTFNFSEAKNASINLATMEYILCLDADEYFEDLALKNLQRLTMYMPYMEADAFAFPRKTFVDGLLVNLNREHDEYQVRFWKNGEGIHYAGILHEGVTGYHHLQYLNVWIMHEKTGVMQQRDNEQYWDMGQEPPPGWVKIEGKWFHKPGQTHAYVDGIPVDELDGIPKEEETDGLPDDDTA